MSSVTELGRAWDSGYDTAASCYWHKPRNPYTGEMNDADPNDYCQLHGGTRTVGDFECSANPTTGGCPGPKE